MLYAWIKVKNPKEPGDQDSRRGFLKMRLIPQKLALLLAIIIVIVFGHNWVKQNDNDTIEDVAADLAASVDSVIKGK
jgi:hypothetical protein